MFIPTPKLKKNEHTFRGCNLVILFTLPSGTLFMLDVQNAEKLLACCSDFIPFDMIRNKTNFLKC